MEKLFKRLLLIPAILLVVSGVSSGSIETKIELKPVDPINTKLDSVNIKAAELKELIRKL